MMAPRRCRTSTEAHASFAGSAPHFPSRVGLAVCFASGMAGIAAIFDQLATGSVVALPDDCYQGVAGLANAVNAEVGGPCTPAADGSQVC